MVGIYKKFISCKVHRSSVCMLGCVLVCASKCVSVHVDLIYQHCALD